jgi:predicted cobalt transporter CbtA
MKRAGLGNARPDIHLRSMKRVRAIAGILGLLAILAGSLMTVASVTAAAATAQLTATHAPCSHCDDCDAVPCPLPASACMQASAGSAATLFAMTVEFPANGFTTVQWPNLTYHLRGLSQPPEPLPPRS